MAVLSLAPVSGRLALGLLIAVSTLAACKKPAGPGEETAASAAHEQAGQAQALQAENEKYNGYVGSYNGLADQFGLMYEAQPYLSKSLDKIGPDGTIRFTFSSDDALKSLKQAREVKSDAYPDLDTIADALIKDLQTLSDIHVQHRNYYQTDAYRDDHFALAKQLDPQIRAAYTDAVEQFHRLDTALNQAEQARNARDLERLKAQPNQLPYATKHVIVLSKQLVDATLEAVRREGDGDFTRADALKPQLYEAVKFMDQQIEQHKTKDDALSGFGMVLFDARNVLSTYGDLRRAKGVAREQNAQLLLNAYNQMISQANQI